MESQSESEIVTRPGIEGLCELIRTLLSENGCPWDRKQSPRTMAAYMTEEAYELLDAVSSGDADHVCEELGDVLFHVFFIAHLFAEKGDFGISDVIAGIVKKMIRRHPHVFGSAEADTPEAVKRQWDIIKEGERGASARASVLDGVSSGLPPLMRAYRVSQKAAGIGFDWENLAGVMEKVKEEWVEFEVEAARIPTDPEARGRAAMEFGDLIFTLANVARFAGFHPDTALVAATRKFEERFRRMELRAQNSNESIQRVPREQLEIWWNLEKTGR